MKLIIGMIEWLLMDYGFGDESQDFEDKNDKIDDK